MAEAQHLQEDGAGFAVAADGRPVEGGAALPITRRDLRVQYDEQAHAVRKALVGRPVQCRPPIYVRAAWQSTASSVCDSCLTHLPSALPVEAHGNNLAQRHCELQIAATIRRSSRVDMMYCHPSSSQR